MPVVFKRGDITQEQVDAIVNAANSGLLGGGGVDGAIHRAGGPAILEACRDIRESQGECPPGEAVITTAGNLSAKYVIHTVGPRWRGGVADEQRVLERAYRNSLELAAAHKLATVAFPSISTGAYGYPVEQAAKVAVKTCCAFLDETEVVREVRFVLFSDEDFAVYRQSYQELQKDL